MIGSGTVSRRRPYQAPISSARGWSQRIRPAVRVPAPFSETANRRRRVNPPPVVIGRTTAVPVSSLNGAGETITPGRVLCCSSSAVGSRLTSQISPRRLGDPPRTGIARRWRRETCSCVAAQVGRAAPAAVHRVAGDPGSCSAGVPANPPATGSEGVRRAGTRPVSGRSNVPHPQVPGRAGEGRPRVLRTPGCRAAARAARRSGTTGPPRRARTWRRPFAPGISLSRAPRCRIPVTATAPVPSAGSHTARTTPGRRPPRMGCLLR